jgi:Na+/phosphate symporter
MSITLKEAFRILVGAIRPELRKAAQEIVNYLPPALRKEWVGRIVGALAQIIEKTEIFGIQESISDVIEIISDEISKQVREKKDKKEEIDSMNEIRKMLENTRERLKQAENVEDEKNRIIAELQAYEAILEIFKTIEEKYVPKEEKKEEKKIDWAKLEEKLKEIIKVINEQGIQKAIEFIKEKYPEAKEEIIRQRDEFLRGLKEGWEKGRKKGLI